MENGNGSVANECCERVENARDKGRASQRRECALITFHRFNRQSLSVSLLFWPEPSLMPSNSSEDSLAIRKRGMNYLQRPGVGFKTRAAFPSSRLRASEGRGTFGGRF